MDAVATGQRSRRRIKGERRPARWAFVRIGGSAMTDKQMLKAVQATIRSLVSAKHYPCGVREADYNRLQRIEWELQDRLRKDPQ